MAVWPASLPQSAFLNVSETRQDATLRSTTDSGAPKVRKRFTAAIRNLDIRMILNGTQKGTFDIFYITTINEGASTFDITDPIDDGTITVRFREVPTWSFINSSGVNPSERYWEAVLKLEVLP